LSSVQSVAVLVGLLERIPSRLTMKPLPSPTKNVLQSMFVTVTLGAVRPRAMHNDAA
jgi:hypothetical protein